MQTCIVHLTRNSLRFGTGQDRLDARPARYLPGQGSRAGRRLAEFEASAFEPSGGGAWSEVAPLFNYIRLTSAA
jgi:hypothetical protein